MSLTAEDFPAVFAAINGDPPFAWQTRLLHTVIKTGWPATIAAPTGAGKTAVLDIALFHLALDPRRAPRRIVFAVDRRVIVDQAHERARHLRAALAAPSAPPVAAMANALSEIAGGDKPLHVEVLRGGMPREDQWVQSPLQPTILSTTVDQLGSRLLFRGYGVSPSMAPIHAGLLGEDALLFLDEAHLSSPFRDTLSWVARRRKNPAQDRALARPWAFSSLTATPTQNDHTVFKLSESESSEATIARRLASAKIAELLELTALYAGTTHIEAFVAAAQQLAKRCPQPAPTIAIIVNRVALARSILRALYKSELDSILLTGRVRPLERDDLIDLHVARLQGKSADTVPSPGKPLFVVATQCVEAGADFDFDAMVTQIAPLDALRQRFGRLNRQGRRDQGPAVIIATKAEIGRNADDPLYKDCLRKTWDWLTSRSSQTAAKSPNTININPNSFDLMVSADPHAAAQCIVTVKSAPVLRPADVAFFAMTRPRPYPDPHLPLFLHGEINAETDVSILWRGDCEIIHQLSAAARQSEAEQSAIAIIACMPPRSGEALRVPVWAARAWLNSLGKDAANISDAESEAESEPTATRHSGEFRRALRWRGPDDDETGFITANQLKPGDMIIVPASYGGCDRFGWSPESTEPVTDLADRAAQPYAKRYFALRLNRTVWNEAEQGPWSEIWSQIRDDIADGPPLNESYWRKRLKRFPEMPNGSRLELERPYPNESDGGPSGAVIIARRGVIVPGDEPEGNVPPATEDDLAGSYDGSARTLAFHSEAVRAQTVRFAAVLALPFRLTQTLAFAAQHHDDGKADIRFQAALGRDQTGELLAKSTKSQSRAAAIAMRAASGLPPNWRHEALSVRIAREILNEAHSDIDRGLALYLIGTHHGHGRPFFAHHDPWDNETNPLAGRELAPGVGPERLDFDWQGRDWPGLVSELHGRYGTWGLAFLEALLRLADHRVSGQST